MLYSKAKWAVSDISGEEVRRLSQQLNISTLLARLLLVRGIADPAEAEAFLNVKEDQFHDPFLLDGMELAVARIRDALARREKIWIYGDYDADGVSSTSLMIGLMRLLEADFDYYIPHRQTEGYGLNEAAIEQAARQGVGLIVTVDTGITAVEEARLARELGIDLIVTDHHEPPSLLPDAYVLINPKKPGCPYPFKSLAGVGVAFKLAHALLGHIPHQFLEYAAIGTIADLMPLTGENRILVKFGLERIRRTSVAGIRALLGVSSIAPEEVTASHIGFSVAPRINASGRLERAETAVICLTTDNEQEAEHLAYDLDRLNKERQLLVEQIVEEALEQAGHLQRTNESGNIIVLAGENWNVGVVGIVASKVLERYYRPTIIVSVDAVTGVAKGSARSIPGFDIHAALVNCADLLDHFGGHQAAAGMTLHRNRLPDFTARLNQYAELILKEEDLQPVLKADMEIELGEISVEMIAELDRLGPYGMNNPYPSFVFNGLRMKDVKLMGKDRQHLKLSILPRYSDTPAMDALAFGKAEWAEQMSPTGMLDLYGELSINEWNGLRRPQIMIKDLRINERQVFDWRGRNANDEAVRCWLNRDQLASPHTCGILIARKEDLQLLPGEQNFPVWTSGGDFSLRLADGSNEPAARAKIEHLLWLTLPDSVEKAAMAIAQFPAVERIYAVLQDTRPYLSCVMPSRDQFRQVYGILSAYRDTTGKDEILGIVQRRTELTLDAIRFILAVFGELEFVREGEGTWSLVSSPPRRELEQSAIYREKLARDETERVFVYSTAYELKEWILSQIDSSVDQRVKQIL